MTTFILVFFMCAGNNPSPMNIYCQASVSHVVFKTQEQCESYGLSLQRSSYNLEKKEFYIEMNKPFMCILNPVQGIEKKIFKIEELKNAKKL